jgi:hypothetical protein
LKEKLILHIGIHKTGSTSLQHFLFDNRSSLTAAGFYYPVEGAYYWHGQRSQSLLSHSILNKRPAYLAHVDFDMSQCISDIKRDVAASPSPQVIISSEHFSEASSTKQFASILEVFSDLFKTINIVVYLRRQDLWLESNWSQLVKDGYINMTFEEFARKEEPNNYYELVRSLADVFGKSNVIVRPFEREQFYRNDLIRDFMHVLGMDIDTSVERLTQLNTSPPVELIELLRHLNKTLTKIEGRLPYQVSANWQANGQFANFLRRLPIRYDNTKYALFTAEARKRFLAFCRESNDRVAVDFLGRESGTLFLEPEISSLPTYPGLSPERMTEITAVAMKALAKANNRLARELKASRLPQL